MIVDKELTETFKYLESTGLTRDQISSLHHFALKGRKLGFSVLTNYFTEGKTLRDNNKQFAKRLLFVAEKHKETDTDYGTLCDLAIEEFPLISNISNTDSDEGSIEQELEDSFNTTVSLEKDLHDYLAKRVHEIENNLVLENDGVEYQVDAGRIDLLAKDSEGSLVVIELKAGKANDNAMGQLLGYMGCLSETSGYQVVRGILVASDFSPRVVYAAKGLGNIKLIKYQLSFKLDEIT